MAIDQKEYEALRAKASSLKAEYHKAEGQLATLKQQLKTDFGCDSIEAAEELIAKMEKRLLDLEEEYETKKAAWVAKYGKLV